MIELEGSPVSLLRTIAAIAAILGIAEAGLEVRASMRGYATPLFGARPASSPATSGTPAALSCEATPDFPFRGERYSAKDAPVIWISSASYAEDTFMPCASIFPSELARLLPARVLNAARAGTTIPANTADLLARARAWRPTACLLYQMKTDVDAISRQVLGPGRVSGSKQHSGGAGEAAAAPSIAVRFVEATSLYTLLKSNVTPLLVDQTILAPDLGPEGAALFRGYLRGWIQACRSIGAEPMVATFPTGLAKAPLTVPMKQQLYQYNRYLSDEGWVRTVREWNGVIRDEAARARARVLDIEPALTGRSHYFRDYIHLSRDGHRAVAESLAASMGSSPKP